MDTINTKSKKFENDLYDIINKSELPVANIYYILQAVFKDFSQFYNDTVNREAAAQSKEEPDQTPAE